MLGEFLFVGYLVCVPRHASVRMAFVCKVEGVFSCPTSEAEAPAVDRRQCKFVPHAALHAIKIYLYAAEESV